MKRSFALALLVALYSLILSAQTAPSPNPAPGASNQQLFLVFLRRAPNAPQYPQDKLEEIQAGHMANIRRLYGEGKLLMAGPFLDDTQLRGIFVFRAQNSDDVKQWLATDPAIKAGRLVGDVHAWHTAKGEIHHLENTDTGMQNYAMLIYYPASPHALEGNAAQAHMQYQLAQFEAGKTVIGGPFAEEASSSPMIGVIIANGTKEDADKLAAADPLVKGGFARVEVHPWMTAKGVLGPQTATGTK